MAEIANDKDFVAEFVTGQEVDTKNDDTPPTGVPLVVNPPVFPTINRFKVGDCQVA